MSIVLSNSKIGACNFFKIQIFKFQQAVNEVKMIEAHINLLVCICAGVVYLVVDQNECINVMNNLYKIYRLVISIS